MTDREAIEEIVVCLTLQGNGKKFQAADVLGSLQSRLKADRDAEQTMDNTN